MENELHIHMNMNDGVYVRLSDDGRRYLRDHLEALGLPDDIRDSLYETYTKTDSEG